MLHAPTLCAHSVYQQNDTGSKPLVCIGFETSWIQLFPNEIAPPPFFDEAEILAIFVQTKYVGEILVRLGGDTSKRSPAH